MTRQPNDKLNVVTRVLLACALTCAFSCGVIAQERKSNDAASEAPRLLRMSIRMRTPHPWKSMEEPSYRCIPQWLDSPPKSEQLTFKAAF